MIGRLFHIMLFLNPPPTPSSVALCKNKKMRRSVFYGALILRCICFAFFLQFEKSVAVQLFYIFFVSRGFSRYLNTCGVSQTMDIALNVVTNVFVLTYTCNCIALPNVILDEYNAARVVLICVSHCFRICSTFAYSLCPTL